MSLQIKTIIEGIEKNIRAVLHNKEFNIDDAKMNIIDLLAVLKDMWIKFEYIFVRMGEIKKIDEATKDGVKYMDETPQNADTKRLYL